MRGTARVGAIAGAFRLEERPGGCELGGVCRAVLEAAPGLSMSGEAAILADTAVRTGQAVSR